MRPFAAAAAVVAALALALPARAADTPAVRVEAGPEGSSRVHAEIDVAAPPPVVWRVMVDCEHAFRIVPRLKACRVLERDPAGRWDVREHRLAGNFFFPDVVTVFHMDYDPPRGLSFRRVSGDMRASDGTWRLSPVDGGRGTHVVYEANLTVGGVPAAFTREVLRRDAPLAMTALKRESEAAARVAAAPLVVVPQSR
jgi:uncharacterized protein YndB with AHSA1/START domain